MFRRIHTRFRSRFKLPMPSYRNVWILAISQALVLSGASMSGLVASLVGFDLAPSRALSTLPISGLIVGNALNIFPSVWLIKRCGRRLGSLIGVGISMLSAVLAILSLKNGSFWGYCMSQFVFGTSLSFVQQYRFAAAESVMPQDVSKAISWILAGSVFSALLGPQIGFMFQHVWDWAPYVGSYSVILIVFALAAVVLRFFIPVAPVLDRYEEPVRSLRDIVKQPNTQLAIFSSVLSYSMMSYIMTATPICMVNIDRFPLHEAKWVIQAHVLGMFVPSFFTGYLIKKWTESRVMLAGFCLYILCLMLSQLSRTYTAYMLELLLLGVGWNFLFISGTSLLTKTYRKSERFKVQGFHDGLTFGAQALATFLAGFMVVRFDWPVLHYVNLAVVIPFGFWLVWGLLDQRKW